MPSKPWVFYPNCYANVWMSPDDPATDPPTYAGLDCQQLAPYQLPISSGLRTMEHRFVLRQSDVGNIGSTELVAGMWIRLVDGIGNNIGWFQCNDTSPFTYLDGMGVPTWEFVFFNANLVNF